MTKPWREVFTKKERTIFAESGVGSYLFASGIAAMLAAADEADALLAENARLKEDWGAIAKRFSEATALMPCGHPAVCAKAAWHEGATGYCRWCAEVESISVAAEGQGW